MSTSRFVIGIDLGTTNTAVSFCDTRIELADGASAPIESFPITQLVSAGEVAAETLLPSFLYLPAQDEFAADQRALPWPKQPAAIVGKFARDHGALVPGRLVSSAKSWLCHPEVDHRSPILPWLAEETAVTKMSPVESAKLILSHVRDAWNHHWAKEKSSKFEDQQVVLTVPASFDAGARELTVEAATAAGLKDLLLLEEPQSAFYAWLWHRGEQWRKDVKPGDVVLVVDLGGGTTDFTLIAVKESSGDLELHRIAVGDHLLLGGDNMDLTLAHAIAKELEAKGTKVDQYQMMGLWHQARQAKEKLFENPKLKSSPITVLGRGRKVVGGTIKTELDRDVLTNVLVDGFFPKVKLEEHPVQQAGIGLQELGLKYETDPAITKHLAQFLANNREQIQEAREGKGDMPTAVLFNGGVFKAPVLKETVLDVLSKWSGKNEPIRELSTIGLDLAVAHGAAYQGLVKRGRGIRIRGGVARSYYVGIAATRPAVPGYEPPIRALCVVPQGTEEGTNLPAVEREFGLLVGGSTQFRFFSSTQRKDDQLGTVVDDWQDTIDELSPIQTTLDSSTKASGKIIPVRLRSVVTEVGTLELWCEARAGNERWKLEYEVREPQAS